jgi:hypothetical protein
MQYLCEALYGGNHRLFAQQLGAKPYRFRDALAGEYSFWLPVLSRVVQCGLANAEWLFCGTGPIRPDATPIAPPALLASSIVSGHPHFNTNAVQYELARPAVPVSIPATSEPLPPSTDFAAARCVHSARSLNRPVLLYLGHDAIAEGVGPLVNTMLTKGYVTGVALSSAAAMRDFELAFFGGRVSQSDRLHEFSELNAAALRSATNGMSYGEVLGRWSFPRGTHREQSVLARAYELHIPATVHLAMGDSMHHFFPAKYGAELGAALGAASYVDTLVFAEEVGQLHGDSPGGVFLFADEGEHCARLFNNACEAHKTDRPQGCVPIRFPIRREYRHTFPALLNACDAVYDGTADDVGRIRRQ